MPRKNMNSGQKGTQRGGKVTQGKWSRSVIVTSRYSYIIATR